MDGVFTGSARAAGPVRVAFLFTGQGPQYAGMGARLYETRAGLPPGPRRVCGRARSAPRAPARGDPGRGGRRPGRPRPSARCPARDVRHRVRARRDVACLGHRAGRRHRPQPRRVRGGLRGRRLQPGRTPPASSRCAGRVMDALPPGAMAAVWMSEAQVAPLLAPHGSNVSIAAVNAPGQVVLSGTEQAVRAVCAGLERDGVRVRRAVDDARLPLADGRARPRGPRRRGGAHRASGTADHRGLERERRRRRGRRADGRVLGPPRADAGSIRRGAGRPARRGHRRLPRGRAAPGADPARPAVRSRRGDVAADAEAGRGRLGPACCRPWARSTLRGVDVDWEAVEQGRPRRRVALPTYPFQRARYWVDAERAAARRPRDDRRGGVGRRRDGGTATDGAGPARPRRGVLSGEVVVARDGCRSPTSPPPSWSWAASRGRASATRGGADRALEPAGRAAASALALARSPGRRRLLVGEGEEFVSPAPLSAGAAGSRAARDARAALADTPALMAVRRALRRAAGRDPVRCGESAGDAVPGRQRRDGRVPLPGGGRSPAT